MRESQRDDSVFRDKRVRYDANVVVVPRLVFLDRDGEEQALGVVVAYLKLNNIFL
jgi:hypothetical protein